VHEVDRTLRQVVSTFEQAAVRRTWATVNTELRFIDMQANEV
jgi:hypothetical protein